MKWAVEIQNFSLGKRNLSDLLQGLGFDLVEGIDYPAIASPIINACGTAAEVFEKAKAVRTAFKGPAQIDPEFTLGSVIDYSTNPPRRHAFCEPAPCELKISMGTPTVTVPPPKGLSPEELERWKADCEERQYQARLEQQRSQLEPAYKSPKATKVIELLSHRTPSAETLYKIYELAEGHPDNRADFHKHIGISKDQFNRFRDAVHNPSVSGDWARHAYHAKPRTSNPMTTGEAEAFVREIADRWLKFLRRQIPDEGA